jgi:hypothetical protein
LFTPTLQAGRSGVIRAAKAGPSVAGETTGGPLPAFIAASSPAPVATSTTESSGANGSEWCGAQPAGGSSTQAGGRGRRQALAGVGDERRPVAGVQQVALRDEAVHRGGHRGLLRAVCCSIAKSTALRASSTPTPGGPERPDRRSGRCAHPGRAGSHGRPPESVVTGLTTAAAGPRAGGL